MISISNKCHSLTHINISNCSNLTDLTLQSLGRNCQNLTVFESPGCNNFSDTGFLSLSRVILYKSNIFSIFLKINLYINYSLKGLSQTVKSWSRRMLKSKLLYQIRNMLFVFKILIILNLDHGFYATKFFFKLFKSETFSKIFYKFFFCVKYIIILYFFKEFIPMWMHYGWRHTSTRRIKLCCFKWNTTGFRIR